MAWGAVVIFGAPLGSLRRGEAHPRPDECVFSRLNVSFIPLKAPDSLPERRRKEECGRGG